MGCRRSGYFDSTRSCGDASCGDASCGVVLAGAILMALPARPAPQTSWRSPSSARMSTASAGRRSADAGGPQAGADRVGLGSCCGGAFMLAWSKPGTRLRNSGCSSGVRQRADARTRQGIRCRRCAVPARNDVVRDVRVAADVARLDGSLVGPVRELRWRRHAAFSGVTGRRPVGGCRHVVPVLQRGADRARHVRRILKGARTFPCDGPRPRLRCVRCGCDAGDACARTRGC